MYHPPGSTNIYVDESTGNAISKPNAEIARTMVDQLRTGGTLFIPRQVGPQANVNPWEYVPGGVGASPEGLLEYGRDLDEEIWQGMGILPEIINAPETGTLGNGGRSIPMDGFNAILHSVFCESVTDIIKQIAHPLVVLNFGREKSYFVVKPTGLLKDANEVDELAQQLEQDPASPDSSGKKKEGTALALAIESAERAKRRYKNYAIHAGGSLSYGE